MIRTGLFDDPLEMAPSAPSPFTSEVRAWARAEGFDVPRGGRLRPEISDAWRAAHPAGQLPTQ